MIKYKCIYDYIFHKAQVSIDESPSPNCGHGTQPVYAFGAYEYDAKCSKQRHRIKNKTYYDTYTYYDLVPFEDCVVIEFYYLEIR